MAVGGWVAGKSLHSTPVELAGTLPSGTCQNSASRGAGKAAHGEEVLCYKTAPGVPGKRHECGSLMPEELPTDRSRQERKDPGRPFASCGVSLVPSTDKA